VTFPPNTSGAFIARFSADGLAQWVQVVTGTTVDALPAVDELGRGYLAGELFGGGSVAGEAVSATRALYVVSLASTGAVRWRSIAPEPAQFAMTKDSLAARAGRVILAGTFSGPFTFAGTTIDSPTRSLGLAALDDAGNQRWIQSFAVSSGSFVSSSSADIDPLGRVGVAATLRGSIDVGGETLTTPNDDIFVVALRGLDGAPTGANLIESHVTSGSFPDTGRIAAGINGVWTLGGGFGGQASFDGHELTATDFLDGFMLRLRRL
jgi:hypothetical protein